MSSYHWSLLSDVGLSLHPHVSPAKQMQAGDHEFGIIPRMARRTYSNVIIQSNIWVRFENNENKITITRLLEKGCLALKGYRPSADIPGVTVQSSSCYPGCQPA